MTAEPVRHQRSEGSIHLSMGPRGIVRLREAHAAKVRIPFGVPEAILINTGGGLAGGDRFSFDITADADTTLTVTSQTAERVYRSLGPSAQVDVTLSARDGARLMWLPQETILFDGAALSRKISADLAVSARFLAVESVILGREAMGESVQEAQLTGASGRAESSSSPITWPSLARRPPPRRRWERSAPLPPWCWWRRKPRTCSTAFAPPSASGVRPVRGLASSLQGSSQQTGSAFANP